MNKKTRKQTNMHIHNPSFPQKKAGGKRHELHFILISPYLKNKKADAEMR